MTREPKKAAPKRITESSGNVFADLGLPNPEQELIKAELTLQILRAIKDAGLTQAEAARVLGIKQPHVSLLMRNRAGSFSVGRLVEFLTALGHDVAVLVTRSRKEHGEMSVTLHLTDLKSVTGDEMSMLRVRVALRCFPF